MNWKRTWGVVLCLGCVVISAVGAGVADPVRDTRQASADAADMLQRFMAELVPVTPGEGPFPAQAAVGALRISRYEMTQELYQLVMGVNPSRWQGPRNSVERLTGEQAAEFCERLTALLRDKKLLSGDHVVRLPTAAEWEYCCRAGSTTVYSFGDEYDVEGRGLGEYAWFTGNAAGNDPAVGVLRPNAWGLYDMHGYLWEYVTHGPPRDPSDTNAGDSSSAGHSVMGGSWRDPADRLGSDSRIVVPRATSSDAVGFRCVVGKQPLPVSKGANR